MYLLYFTFLIASYLLQHNLLKEQFTHPPLFIYNLPLKHPHKITHTSNNFLSAINHRLHLKINIIIEKNHHLLVVAVLLVTITTNNNSKITLLHSDRNTDRGVVVVEEDEVLAAAEIHAQWIIIDVVIMNVLLCGIIPVLDLLISLLVAVVEDGEEDSVAQAAAVIPAVVNHHGTDVKEVVSALVVAAKALVGMFVEDLPGTVTTVVEVVVVQVCKASTLPNGLTVSHINRATLMTCSVKLKDSFQTPFNLVAP
jgi:hypothetical protein